MAISTADTCKMIQLGNLISGVLGGASYHLFKNSVTPTHTSVISDFTESTFPGYSAQTVGWLSTVLDGSFAATVTGSPMSFTPSGDPAGEQVYGYYVTDSGGNYIYAELNPAGPVTLTLVGVPYVVVPYYQLQADPAP